MSNVKNDIIESISQTIEIPDSAYETAEKRGATLLRGTFDFVAQRPGRELIADAYALSIRVPRDFPADLPVVVELARKIPRDGNHHVNSDDTLCLGAPLRLLREVATQPTLIGFAHRCLVPYLYAVSHKLRFGGPFVFDELAHGAKGVLSDYVDLFGLKRPSQAEAALRLLGVKKRRANKRPCPCGCGRRLGACRLNSVLKQFRGLAPRRWFRAQIAQIDDEREITRAANARVRTRPSREPVDAGARRDNVRVTARMQRRWRSCAARHTRGSTFGYSLEHRACVPPVAVRCTVSQYLRDAMTLDPCQSDAKPVNRSQARLNCSLVRWFLAVAALLAGAAAEAAERRRDGPRDGLGRHAASCLETVRAFADTVLDKGRDRYGARHTPLFVDGLHVETAQPVIWMGRDGAWVISNFINQQPLMRLLDGLSAVTGNPKYREAAEAAAAHVLEHVVTPNGFLHWGGHRAWDLAGDKPVGQNVHEIKTYQPYYELMWRVNPVAARRLAEAMWAGHVTDWALLDYNRHASSITAEASPRWDAPFDEGTPVPWLAKARTLSFANVTPPLLQAGGSLFFHENDEQALRWTRRLARRWQDAKHPKTGLSGGQLSYWTPEMGCRAQQGFGHVHPGIHEAMMITTYHRQSRYHDIPLVQMQLGEELLRGRQSQAVFGRELIDWAVADLKAYGRHAYDPELQAFVPLLTDGTRLQWEQVRPGYYRDHLDSLGPAAPDSRIFWVYAKAYRLSGDAELWQMLRHLSRAMGFGELGSAAPEPRRLRFSADAGWVATDRQGGCGSLYAMLELHRATADPGFLQVAAQIAEHIARTHFRNGLFPRAGRVYARTGDEIPLALLHLVAAIENKAHLIPVDKVDSQFYHDIYFGPLEPHQIKPGDARTRDNLVFYDPLPVTDASAAAPR